MNLSSAYLDANEKAFMFVPMEIAFYKKHRIALPREQYTTRHQQRMKLLDKKELYLRMCDKT